MVTPCNGVSEDIASDMEGQHNQLHWCNSVAHITSLVILSVVASLAHIDRSYTRLYV